jgi:hypothetical protein
LILFIALPIRGAVAAYLIGRSGVYPVQVLDCIGAGLQSVAVPGVVARTSTAPAASMSGKARS